MIIIPILLGILVVTAFVCAIMSVRREDYADDLEQSAYLREWYEKHKKDI